MLRSALPLLALSMIGCGDDTTHPPTPDLSVPVAPDLGMAGGDLAVAGGHGDLAGGGGDDGGGNPMVGPDMTPPASSFPFTVVLTVILENHDYDEIVGNTTNAPYINSLIQKYGLATNYYDIGHPSLPNYVYMVSGNRYPNANLASDGSASDYPALLGDNLGNQLQTAHIPWRAYMETMRSPCQLTDTGDRVYAARHNPFVYFDNIVNGPDLLCDRIDVDYTRFAADLNAGTYKLMWITPNVTNDGHGVLGTEDPYMMLKISDDWCAQNIPPILDSAVFKAGGLLLLTWDEAEGRTGPDGKKHDPDKIPMIVISPKLVQPGMTSAKMYTHASYLATMEDIFGLPRLNEAVGAPNLLEFIKQ
jgi:hypothetical protein